jgi:hypothetical protein
MATDGDLDSKQAIAGASDDDVLAHLDILGVKKLAHDLGGAGGRFGPDDHRGAVGGTGIGRLDLRNRGGDADPELGAQGHQLPAFEAFDGEILFRVSGGTRRRGAIEHSSEHDGSPLVEGS